MLFWLAQEQARANVLLCKVLRIIHRTIKIQMSTQDCSHKNVWDIRRRCGFLSKHSWIPGLCVRGPALFHLTTFRFLHQIQAPPELGSGATGAGVWELYPWASGCSKNSSTTWAELGKNFDSSTSSRASFAQLGSCHWTCQVSTNDISYYYVIRIYIYIIYIHTEYMYIYIYWFTYHLKNSTVSGTSRAFKSFLKTGRPCVSIVSASCPNSLLRRTGVKELQ